MTCAKVVADTFIVAPEFHFLILAAGNEMLAFPRDGKRVHFAFFRAIEHPDRLAIEGFPVRDFAVTAGGEQLTFFRVVEHHLEQRAFEEAHEPSEAFQVPDDARPIS